MHKLEYIAKLKEMIKKNADDYLKKSLEAMTDGEIERLAKDLKLFSKAPFKRWTKDFYGYVYRRQK